MKRENLENALANISDEILAESAVKATPKRRRVKLSRIIVPAAVLAMLMATLLVVNAAAPVDLSFYVTSQFGGGYEMVDEMTSLPTTTTTRYSDDTLSIELKGVLGDVATAYIFFDATVAPGVELPEGYNLDVKLHELGLPWDSLSYGTSWGEHTERIKNEDGSTTHCCYISINQTNLNEDASYSLSNRGFSVVVDRIFTFDENHQRVTVKDGKWSIGFVLDYKDLTDVYEIGEEITISKPEHFKENMIATIIEKDENGNIVYAGDGKVVGQGTLEASDGETTVAIENVPIPVEDITFEAGEDITIRVDRITLSPISTGVYFSMPKEISDKFVLEPFTDYIGLRMKDGSIIATNHSIFYDIPQNTVGGSSGGGGPSDDGRMNYHGILNFKAPIDLTEVAAFIISDVEIPLE